MSRKHSVMPENKTATQDADEANYPMPFGEADETNLAMSLENAAIEAALADGLITHGAKADKQRKGDLRRGKWTIEEENYSNRLITEFKQGLLPLTDGTTLRTFLSKLLNCDPMRISKKFVGAKCIGKQVFRRRQTDLDRLSPEQLEASRIELAELERQFLERVAQTNKTKTAAAPNGQYNHAGEFIEGQPAAPWLTAPDADGAQRQVALKNNHTLQQPYAYATQQQPQQPYGDRRVESFPMSESASDMLEFRNIMASSSGALASLGGHANNSNGHHYQQPQLVRQQQQLQQPSPRFDQFGQQFAGNYAEGDGTPYQRVSSLEVLCAVDNDGSRGAPASGMYHNAVAGGSFPWMLSNGSLGRGAELGGGTDVSGSPLNMNGSYYTGAGGGGGGGGGSSGGLPYTSSAEWPSMNNLVVAAETIEQLGSMHSLYGGGLGPVAAMGRAAIQQAAMGGTGPQATNNSGQQRRGSIGTAEEAGMRNQDYVHYYRGGGDEPSRLTMGPEAAAAQQAVRVARIASEDLGGDVGYPLDEDDNVKGVADSLQIQNPAEVAEVAGAEDDQLYLSTPREGVENTPISSMLLANDMLLMSRLPSLAAEDSQQQMYRGAPGQSGTPVRPASAMAKTASVDNFWMLVGMGDLPQPEKNVLCKTLWQGNPPPPASATAAAASPLQGLVGQEPNRARKRPAIEVSASFSNDPADHSSPRSPRVQPDTLPPFLDHKHAGDEAASVVSSHHSSDSSLQKLGVSKAKKAKTSTN